MNSMTVGELIQAGGVLAFAYIVYRELSLLRLSFDHFVVIATKSHATNIRIMERQDVILERQSILYARLHNGEELPDQLPAAPPKNGVSHS